MNQLVRYCETHNLFKTAYKKVRKFKQVFSIRDKTPNTYYIHEGELSPLSTKIAKTLQTANMIQHGDFVITGPFKEKYVVKAANIARLYNLVDGVLMTRQIPKQVAHITPDIFKSLNLPLPKTY